MLEVLLLLARYVFLFLLYFFIFVVYRGLLTELRRAPVGESGGRGRWSAGQWQLVVVASGSPELPAGQVWPVRGTVTLGRMPSNTIVLPDRFASGHHARLSGEPQGDLWLEDLQSTNGTKLNGERVTKPTPLREGDEIEIGSIRLRVQKGN